MFAKKPSFKVLAIGFLIKSIPLTLIMYLVINSWPSAICVGVGTGVFGTAMVYWLSGREEEIKDAG